MARPIRRGNQQPTFSTIGEWAYSDGDYAVEVFKEYGVSFYESQEYEMRVFLARNEDGSYSALTICISKPRQNGKSFAARHYAIWMAAIEGKNVLFSAHNGSTTREMFKQIANFVEGTPDLAMMLKPNGAGIYRAAGHEGIYFVDEEGNPSGLIEFQTRTTSGARGRTYQIIIVDEAQELTDEQLDALKPTQLAAADVTEKDSDPQMIYLGTPPNTKCPGTIFRNHHDNAHSGEGGGVWWMEWSAPKVIDKSNRETIMEMVYQTNPAMGYRIKEKTMLDMLDNMSSEGFARECLGWWDKTVVATRLIQAADWRECSVSQRPKDGLLVYAVKFSPDGTRGAIAVCMKPDEGKPYVEVVTSRVLSDGIEWFVNWLVERKGKPANIVIDGRSNAEELYNRLVAGGVSKSALCIPKTGEVITACSSIVNAVKEHRIEHFEQPDLTDSATLSGKRKIGSSGGFGFESNDKADATLIEACALAYWKAMTTKRNPNRKLRIG